MEEKQIERLYFERTFNSLITSINYDDIILRTKIVLDYIINKDGVVKIYSASIVKL